jgi:hypothetical protein
LLSCCDEGVETPGLLLASPVQVASLSGLCQLDLVKSFEGSREVFEISVVIPSLSLLPFVGLGGWRDYETK